MLQWSHRFIPFKPIDIQLKIDLEGSDLKSGDICQIVMTPDDRFSVGKYNQEGNGQCHLNDVTQKDFIEHIHFEFKE